MRRRTLLPAVALAGVLLISGCGSDAATSSTAPASTPSSAVDGTADDATTTTVAVPDVELPTEMPTSLVSTVITEGSGDAAASGDAVVVRYVGVRSEDGTRFDDNYSGDPFPVQIGAGSVIPGWDQGLVGVTTGERLQLDVPADLAYGDTPPGEIIQPGDALSFVIDVLAVIPATTEADQPQVAVTAAANRSDLQITDLVDGTGAELQDGQHAVLHLIAVRGDTGEQVYSTWAQGQPLSFQYGVDDIIPGIANGVAGMKVGGRRQLTVPFEQAFGTDGSETLGIPGSTDVVLVVDLVAAY